MPSPSAQVAPRTLPFDVIHLALKLLPQADLRKAAAASRAFRQAAKQAGLFIHRSILWDPDADDIDYQITAFLEVLAHTKATNGRLSFSLAFDGFIPDSPEESSMLYESMEPSFNQISDGIAQAIPYLVSLHLALPDYFHTDMDALLCRNPAPHLREFHIQDVGIQGELREGPLIPLPRELFAGDAPKLRSVSLSHVPLPPDPLAAFGRVTHAHLEFRDMLPALDVPRHFPALDSLHIEYLREEPCHPAPGCILKGLKLSGLTIDSRDHNFMIPAITAALDLASIPVVTFVHDAEEEHDWDWTLRPQDRTGLTVTISGNGAAADDDKEDVDVVLSLPRAGWRRAFRVREWALEQPDPLLSRGGESGIVSLCLENKFLPGLLESGIAFPTLRDMRIQLRARGRYARMIWPLAWDIFLGSDDDGDADGLYSIPCPRLETLSIVAPSPPMGIEGKEVLKLATALGQSGRRAARLVLSGVTLKGSVSLSELFSSVVS